MKKAGHVFLAGIGAVYFLQGFDAAKWNTKVRFFLVEGKIMVELKALTKLEDVHLAQALNYLRAYILEIGLLISFGP